MNSGQTADGSRMVPSHRQLLKILIGEGVLKVFGQGKFFFSDLQRKLPDQSDATNAFSLHEC